MARQRVSLERLIARIRALDGETLAEVEDFVELLFQKKGKTATTLSDVVRQRALASVTLEQVREGEATPEKHYRARGLFCQDIVTETIFVETMGEEDKAVAATLLEKYGLRANLRAHPVHA